MSQDGQQVGKVLVSGKVARERLLKEGAREPARAFESFPPHHCKLCGAATPLADQARHFRAHQTQLDREAREVQRQNAANLRAVNRLRRETKVATANKTQTRKRQSGKRASARPARTPASDLHQEVQKISARQAAVAVVKRASGPLPIKTVVDRVLAMKNVKLAGATPRATVAKSISLEVAKPDGEIVRVDTGQYDSRERAKKGARV